MTAHQTIANGLPRGAKDLLFEHIDGESFIKVKIVVGDREASRGVLLERKLIRYDSTSARPASTIITEDGRYVLATLLARYAEELIRAGYGIEAEARFAGKDDIVLLRKHVRDLPLPLDQSGTSALPEEVS